ncbi:MAG: TolC family protein [candidate division Zixibacteria bacterium]|nr:TolC family protein [candidate division Zixibacteria bacterium]
MRTSAFPKRAGGTGRLSRSRGAGGASRIPAGFVIFLLIIVIIVLPGCISGEPLTLSRAVELALQNNDQIKQYSERVSEKTHDDREAWGNFLPSVSFQGGYTHLNDDMQIDLSPIRSAIMQMQAGNQVEMANIYSLLQSGTPLTSEQRDVLFGQYFNQLDARLPAFVETLKKQDYRTATLVGLQPIFMGGKLVAAKKAAAAERRASEAELVKVENDIVAEAVTRYLSVALFRDVVKTRQNVLAGMEHHRDDARKLYDEGLIARYQLLRAEVAVADAERNLFDDQNRLELAMVGLRHTLGLPDEAPVTITDSMAYVATPDSLAAFQGEALQGQPLLHMIAEKKKAAAQKLAVERSEFLPHLYGFGKYEMYPEYLSIMEPRWAVGIQFSMNLFSGAKRYERLQSARHLTREVGYLESGARRQIDLLVQKTYRDMRNAEERYRKLAANVALGEENLRVNESRFRTGLGTSLDVIDARLSLEKNQVERLLSLFDYLKSMTDLYTAVGEPRQVLTLWETRSN